jgi:hypothetical protein
VFEPRSKPFESNVAVAVEAIIFTLENVDSPIYKSEAVERLRIVVPPCFSVPEVDDDEANFHPSSEPKSSSVLLPSSLIA